MLRNGQAREIAAHEALFRNSRDARREFKLAQIGAVFKASVS